MKLFLRFRRYEGDPVGLGYLTLVRRDGPASSGLLTGEVQEATAAALAEALGLALVREETPAPVRPAEQPEGGAA